MTKYTDDVAAVRAARTARDTARDTLYRLQLRRLALGAARQREARGEAATDPADRAALVELRAGVSALTDRHAAIRKRHDAIAAVAGEIEAIRRRLASAPERMAAAVREVNGRAAALDAKQPPDERRRRHEALRRAQAARAALAVEVQQDRDALAAKTAQAKDADALRDQLAALDVERKSLMERIDETNARMGKAHLSDQAKQNLADIEAQRTMVAERERAVRASIDALVNKRAPPQLMADWDDRLPILLLPVRIETRWKPGAGAGAPSQLWVRVFPDDIATTSHEPVLTDAEVAYGHAYWTSYRAAGTDADRQAAWTALADRFGANRASWVALETQPTNWDAAAGDSSIPLQFPDVPITKPSAWTTAPHARVLPDRFVLLAWRDDNLRLTSVGEPVDDVVVLGPSPSDDAGGEASIDRAADKTLAFGDAFAWVRDFDLAVKRGLGFRIDVAEQDAATGFDRMIVIGIKHSADAPDAQLLVEQLIDGHHYSRKGFSLVPQGTSTNNTDGSDSGYSRGSAGESGVAESAPAKFAATPDRAVAADGQRFADYLGLQYRPLLHADGAELTDHADAVWMNRALYAGTLGYYLDHMLNEAIDDSWLGVLRRHFTDHVTGRGPIAAIRVGHQPYGVLPTSSLKDWKPRVDARRVADPFEAAFLAVLRRLDEAWSGIVPSLVQVGSPGDGAANLLTILGLQPTSAEFYQRVGYSYDYLANLEAFAWGGSNFRDVLNMMIEAAGARTVLGELGYRKQHADGTPKPSPLLLELIWRHYHTQLDASQLVDGLPFSESALIQPYDAAGTQTYLDWLVANGADAAALERQDFGGVPAPTALLYLMLHFSVVMEGARAVRGWLVGQNVNADELVRSRKFLNVGPQASPSIWEVIKAPANAIVPAATSSAALLTLMNAPQFAESAGQSVQEQRAAIGALRSLTTARLERALVEHIDTLSYRLDAWETSLFARRLDEQRNLAAAVDARRTGVYVGAYGYLENVRPPAAARQHVPDASLPASLRQGNDNLYTDPSNGGYVHAPSLNHAAAAALLRSGYLTHASATDPDALAVDLSSGRVARANALLDGVRHGQSLEALLGVQFERGLHDWTTRPTQPVILDQLKPLFRAKFPILKTLVPQANAAAEGAGASQIAEDDTVTNGLTLARTTDAYPYGIHELSALTPAQQNAIRAEKAAIEDTLDSLRDVLTAEAAYQLALGNFDRAAAVLQSAGSGTAPPDVQVLDTPRGTALSFTQRFAVQLTTAPVNNPWPAVPLSERAKLEPSLNAWLGDLIGPPDTITCQASALASDGSVLIAGGAPVQATISLADLALQPIDFVFMVRSQVEASGAAELEQRVRNAFAKARAVADEVVVKIAFADPGAVGGGRSFAEILPMADRLRRLLGKAHRLDGRHFQSASKDTAPMPDNPGRIDAVELRTRVGDRVAAIRALFPILQAVRDAASANATVATVDALRDALLGVANAGFSYAVPQSAFGAGAASLDRLTQQADAVLKRAAILGTATDDALTEIDATASPEKRAAMLSDLAKGWVGSDFLLLPRFAFPDAASVGSADAARDRLLDYVTNTAGQPLPVDEWLHGVACVRPLMHDFEMVRVMAETWRDAPLRMSPLQLPFRNNDSWLGAPYPPTMDVAHDTISMVQHLPQGFDAAMAQSGLLIDEWVESVPARDSVTGIAFNFDAPNSAPPQALLLVVTPEETGAWQWDHLVDAVLDTFRRARLRAVEPDALATLPAMGTLLPAVVAEFGTSAASVSLDYAMSLPIVKGSLNTPIAVTTNPG